MEKHKNDVITLGMVGIVPQRKRFDRAVNVLKLLIKKGLRARLLIKGPRPEELDFMHAPGRVEELAYYETIYREIELNPQLRGKVEFSGWGNNVADWYRDVDFILSPSEFESFHYALADGILSGCTPLIWPWDGAEGIYHPDWLISDEQEAVSLIMKTRELTVDDRIEDSKLKRTLLVERYGTVRIFDEIDRVLYGDLVT